MTTVTATGWLTLLVIRMHILNHPATSLNGRIRWYLIMNNTFLQNRFILSELVKKGIRLKYRRSYLGIVWSLLEPLLTMIVLTIVFGTLMGIEDPTFPVYILAGRLFYGFFSQGTTAALKSIRANSSIIKKVYVPKMLYPISAVLFNYVIFLFHLLFLREYLWYSAFTRHSIFCRQCCRSRYFFCYLSESD